MRRWKLGFSFLGAAALLAAASLGLALAQVKIVRRFLLSRHGPIAISALGASIAKRLRFPSALRSSKLRPQPIAR